jgi:hypothetical protein
MSDAKIDKTELHAKSLGAAKTEAEETARSLQSAFSRLIDARTALEKDGILVSDIIFLDDPVAQAAWIAYDPRRVNEAPMMAQVDKLPLRETA